MHVKGFMQKVKELPPPETKQEKEARLSLQSGGGGGPAVPIPAPADDDDAATEHLHHDGHVDAEHLGLPAGPQVVVPDMHA